MAVAGGEPEEGTVELYDPATDSWSRLPDMPVSLKYAGAKARSGELFVVGGQDDEGSYSGAVYALRSSGQWEEAGDIPGAAGEEGLGWPAVTLADKDQLGC